MQEKITDSIDYDYFIVVDSYFSFIKQYAGTQMPHKAVHMMLWYQSILAKLNSMRAELSPCQQ